MNFKHIVFVLASLAYVHSTFPFPYELIVNILNKRIVQIGSSTTPDYTKVTFFSDYHKKSSVEQEQITSLIHYLQEHKDVQPFHILVEEASEFHKKFASGYEILYTLNKHIKQANPPLTHVMLDNIDVRCISLFAMTILDHYDLYDQYGQYELNDAKKTIGTITFQDVLDEFDQIKQSLAGYYCNHTNQAIATIYADSIKTAEGHCQQFKRKITNASETVLAYAKAQCDKRLLACYEQEKNMAIISNDIRLSFTPLFDLNLLKNILTSDSQNILVFAGGNHTEKVMDMLSTLKATTIFQARNAVIQDVMQKNGFTRKEEVVSPVTKEQILQALSAQPKSVLTQYAPTIGYMTMVAAALCYLLLVVLPEHVYGHA